LVSPDPCRLARQVKKFIGWLQLVCLKLLHLPDEPAGVGVNSGKPS
jgi:hypothetical protein